MMDYSPAGRINSKSNYSLNGNEEITGYDRSYYHYDSRILEGTRYDQGKPSQIMKNGNITRLKWDQNGNFTEKSSNGMGQAYYWDEENRLTAMYQGNQFAYYVYDAGGERVFKNLGLWETMNISGRWYDMIDFRETVMYPFPYIVATPKGYTKHYYAGYQRICSKIGGGGLSELKSTDMLWEEKHDNDREAWNNYFMYYLGFDDSYDVNFRSLFSLSDDYIDELFTEDEAYYYHTDHLGSSTEIVHKEKIIQKLEYLPFGELWSDKRYSGSWEAPYTFSGKERDSETGFSYFGARYYDSDMNIWLSVDPMLDALPYLSPYVYCSNNPIGRVDPDGRLDDDYFNQYGKYLGSDNSSTDKVRIIKQETWDQVKDNISWTADDGSTIISSGAGNAISQDASQSNMSDKAQL